MRYAKLLSGVLVLLLVCAIAVPAEETKQESTPGTAQEMKQDTKKDAMQEAAPAAGQEKKQEVKQEGEHQHEHTMGKEKRVVATVGPDGVQHVEIMGDEYYYDPNYIVLKVNVPVELSVKKAPGYIPHDMVVNAPEAGIDFKVDLDAKKPDIVKFTPTKVGKYPLYCDKKLLFFKSHRERGMEGVIEVVE